MTVQRIRFDVFTLLPEVFTSYLQSSIMLKARQQQALEVVLHHLRNWTTDRHHVTDDEPYGGGGGMIMKPEPLFAAIEGVLGESPSCPVVLLTPQGRLFTQSVALEYAQLERLALICGRYEGVDERVRQHLVTDELSIGDFVLTGGELPALVVIDAVARLLPGVLGDPEGAREDSHATGLLEYPHYTRPSDFRGWQVPEVLLSGDHGRIGRWRREQALRRTFLRRRDLLQRADLDQADREFISRLSAAENSALDDDKP